MTVPDFFQSNHRFNSHLVHRPRRLRKPLIRNLIRENHLRASDLIMPIFIAEGKGVKEDIPNMPGQYRYSLDQALKVIKEWVIDEKKGKPGIGALLLFGIPDPKSKDYKGSPALDPKGLIPRSVEAIKSHFPQILIITDLCFCEYTDHGHCGIINQDGELDNDRTLDILGEQAIIHAQAGVDIVAPSGMVDGMVGVIRQSLDNGKFNDVAIMSYTVKYVSHFYGPFRSAVNSIPGFGNRRGYQMDPANAREALRETERDVVEGVDILMVKPGMPYLDIVRDLFHKFPLPLAVYQVSGEYAMIKWASQNGSFSEREAVMESLLAMKRAGASMIISYFAAEVAKYLP